MMIAIYFLLSIIKSDVDAFLYDAAIPIIINFRLKRELDVDVAAVFILNSVAHRPLDTSKAC